MTVPEPMTPPDCDLRGLEYMPLLGQRLFGSEFDALANDSEWRAGLTLWWAAWTQCPAGSLPDDDAALCRLADLGRDIKTFRKLRVRALHGFVKCSDGRLYHPTLCEQALVAWDKRVKERARKAQWRAKKSGQDEGQDGDVPPAVPRDRTRTEPGQNADVPADVTRRDSNTVANATGAEAPPADLSKVIFATGVALLCGTGMADRSARTLIGKWRKQNGDAWTRDAIISAEGRSEPVAWIEGRRKAQDTDADEARAISSATAERYRQMDMPGPPSGTAPATTAH
ncbi:YdaU family protein [Sphingomonas montana]|uniref:YdaU family protein n=1 Tax=Sphingomonas montana TaxID=1843236 RepID=UPI0013EC700C|nr:YdaU family protein [Sphingomonas montana]